MEILAIIGIIVIALVVFTGGGLIGWVLKGIGAIFEFLGERIQMADIAFRGPLKKPTTNQRFYRQDKKGSLEDVISIFWKK